MRHLICALMSLSWSWDVGAVSTQERLKQQPLELFEVREEGALQVVPKPSAKPKFSEWLLTVLRGKINPHSSRDHARALNQNIEALLVLVGEDRTLSQDIKSFFETNSQPVGAVTRENQTARVEQLAQIFSRELLDAIRARDLGDESLSRQHAHNAFLVMVEATKVAVFHDMQKTERLKAYGTLYGLPTVAGFVVSMVLGMFEPHFLLGTIPSSVGLAAYLYTSIHDFIGLNKSWIPHSMWLQKFDPTIQKLRSAFWNTVGQSLAQAPVSLTEARFRLSERTDAASPEDLAKRAYTTAQSSLLLLMKLVGVEQPRDLCQVLLET